MQVDTWGFDCYTRKNIHDGEAQNSRGVLLAAGSSERRLQCTEQWLLVPAVGFCNACCRGSLQCIALKRKRCSGMLQRCSAAELLGSGTQRQHLNCRSRPQKLLVQSQRSHSRCEAEGMKRINLTAWGQSMYLQQL